MIDCKLAHTPMNEGTRLIDDMETELVDSILYSRMVGKLVYLTHTRPDISFAVSTVSRFLCLNRNKCTWKRSNTYLDT